MTKKIIVGIDPGTYVGIAIFDIRKNLISACTIKNGGREKVVEEIIRHGTPSVVVTDVTSPPEFVIHIATYFNARICSPETTISEQEKISIAHSYDYQSPHERDAIAAVLKFFKQYENKFRWADKLIAEKGLEGHEDEIKHNILAGVRITDTIKALEMINLPPIKAHVKESNAAGRENERRVDRETILELLESNARLRSRISILSAEKAALENRIKEVKREFGMSGEVRKLLESKDMQIKRLRMLLERKEQKKAEQASRKDSQTSEKPKITKAEPDLEDVVGLYRNERMKKMNDYREY